jgi:hypothetical protein
MARRGLTILALAVTALCAALLAGPAAASWTTPADDLSPAGQNPSAPELAVGPDGAATAIWPDNASRIWSSRRAPGGSWGTPVPLSGIGPSATGPHVAAGPGGTAAAVWISSEGGGTVVVRRFQGGSWGPEAPLADSVGDARPRVAIGGDGVATVVWRAPQPGPPATGAIIARRSAGNGWDAPKLLSGSDDTNDPRVAAGPGDAVTVVWERFDSGTLAIRAHRFTGGAWRDQVEQVSPDGQDAAEPDVAMGPDGSAVVAWQRFDGGEYVRAARLVGDTWVRSGDLSVRGDNTSDIGVAAGQGGVAAVAWRRTPQSGPDIAEIARFDGQSWTPGAQALSDPAFGVDTLDVAVGPDGVATVAWVRIGGPNNLAQARRAGPGFLGDVHTLEPGADSDDTRLAAAPDGAVTALWRAFTQNAGEYRVRSSRFLVPPPAPTGVSAVAGDARATVTWIAPALTGGEPITGYLVTATPGGATCATTGALSCTVEGLTNGVAYTFNVRAINARGTGPASAESAPVTPAAAAIPAPAPVPVIPLPALSMTGVAVAPRVAVRGRPSQTTRRLTIRATLNRQARLRVLFQRQAPVCGAAGTASHRRPLCAVRRPAAACGSSRSAR